ncbi:MAG: BCCT family transporter [Spirochaetales bacterium]|nr:BCCT family transporter [Spirochaetales bacterium]
MAVKDDKYSIENTDYTVGQENVQKWGFDVHNPVFAISAGLIVLFLGATLISDAASAKAVLDGLKWKIIANFDFLFIWSCNIFVLFCVVLIFSPFAKLRLGGKDAVPEHSTLSWPNFTRTIIKLLCNTHFPFLVKIIIPQLQRHKNLTPFVVP